MPSNIVVAERGAGEAVASAAAAWTAFSSLDVGELSRDDIDVLGPIIVRRGGEEETMMTELKAATSDNGPWAFTLNDDLIDALSKTTQAERYQIAVLWRNAQKPDRAMKPGDENRILRTLARQCLTAKDNNKTVYLRIASPLKMKKKELQNIIRSLEQYEDYTKKCGLPEHQQAIVQALAAYERGEEPAIVPFPAIRESDLKDQKHVVQRKILGHSYIGQEQSVPMEAFTEPGASLVSAKPEECIIRSFSGLEVNALTLIEESRWKELSKFELKDFKTSEYSGRTAQEDATRGFILDEESLADAADGKPPTISESPHPSFGFNEITISLSTTHITFIHKTIENGTYTDISEVISEALTQLSRRT